MARRPGRLVSRDILPEDLPAIAALLREGFPDRTISWFHTALACVARLPAIPGMPRFGYVLVDDGQPVGTILTIASRLESGGGAAGRQVGTRLNVACWYMRPRYRAYGTLLYQRLLALRDVTLINVTPASHTLSVIESQGFVRFSSGTFAAVPLLARHAGNDRAIAFAHETDHGLSPAEHALLAVHADAGCIALLCGAGGRRVPFVFRRRVHRRLPPAAHLIYCRDMDDLRRHAGAIGRGLARHGIFWITAGTSGRPAGLAGCYFHGKTPMYYKGPLQPAPNNIAYTEVALFPQ